LQSWILTGFFKDSSMLTIRSATVADAALIQTLIAELAEYENGLEQVRVTEADIARDGFGADPQFRALIAEWSSEPVGFALFFRYYSTWRGAGLYLEDLYVRPEFRRRGIGTSLLAGVAREAERENRSFVRWVVLDWNAAAIGMYKMLGANFLDEWRTVLLAGEGLKKLVKRDSCAGPTQI
jgi:GNAT superfamily N-acetyltransferase